MSWREDMMKDKRSVEAYVQERHVLIQITQLGISFEREGALIGRGEGESKATYFVPTDAADRLTDEIAEEVQSADTEQAKLDILVKHKILSKIISKG